MNNDNSSEINHAHSVDKLNKLRAAVLGANDGIVSTAAVVAGVAGATNNTGAIFTAGLAALVAGALSMAVGEYVSVSSQSDAEKAFIDKEKKLLRRNPERELTQLAAAYEDMGLSAKTAKTVAKELSEKDAMKAHLRMHFNIEEEDIVNPMHAALASLVAFTAGGLVPFLAVLMSPENIRLWVAGVAVIAALYVTGYYSANVGGASRRRAIFRVVVGGVMAMVITFIVGRLFGTAIA